MTITAAIIGATAIILAAFISGVFLLISKHHQERVSTATPTSVSLPGQQPERVSTISSIVDSLHGQRQQKVSTGARNIDSLEVARFIEVLESHAVIIRDWIKDQQSLLLEEEPNGGKQTKELKTFIERFEKIHLRCLSAYKSGNLILGHELSNQINQMIDEIRRPWVDPLLWERHWLYDPSK